MVSALGYWSRVAQREGERTFCAVTQLVKFPKTFLSLKSEGFPHHYFWIEMGVKTACAWGWGG